MGFYFENNCYILYCDKCGVKHNLINIFEAIKFKNENKWLSITKPYTKEYRGKSFIEYCNSCATALGHIKSQGVKINEC